jgi:hypothetical protein
MDSGASGHIVSDSEKFQQTQHSSGPQIREIRTGGGESHPVVSTGTSSVRTDSGVIKLANVKYVPSMKKNLISVGSIADGGNLVIFDKSQCWIIDKHDNGKILATGHRNPSNRLYCFGTSFQANLAEHSDSTSLWHRRFGHLSFSGLHHLSANNRVTGLPIIREVKRVCKCCLAGRQCRAKFPQKSDTRATRIAEKVHSDLMGPMQQPSLGGSRYILVFTDDLSRKSWTYFLKCKSETFEKFKIFKEMIELETGNKVGTLRTDRGGEYTSHEFKQYCFDHGIRRELTQAYTPQQNGISERRNRTLMERARSLASDCNLPVMLWSEAVSTANYLTNHSPTSANGGKTPQEIYSGKIPNVSHFRIFGSLAFVHVPKEGRKKLDSKTQACLFLGYDDESKTFRLFDPEKCKVVLSRDVVCDESRVGYQFLTNKSEKLDDLFSISFNSNEDFDTTETTGIPHEQPNLEREREFPDIVGEDPDHTPDIEKQISSSDSSSSDPHNSQPRGIQSPLPESPVGRRYPLRKRIPSTRYKDFWALVSEVMEEPLTFAEADKDKAWQAATKKEIDSILRNKTWDVVDRPRNRKPISGKWLFKIKRGLTGVPDKLKARVVARGFQQQEGIDYTDIFAPVVRWSTIRIVLALAAKKKWSINQMDVVTAFLNGFLEEEIYMEIPDGFPGAGDPTKVCKINRALYGLKQAPKSWYERIDAWFINQGLKRSENDPNMYYSLKDEKYVIILLYVDDLLITGDNSQEISRLQSELQKEFEMSDLGTAQNYLGVEIEYHPSGIFLHQRSYIRKLLEKFKLQNCNSAKLPMDPKTQLQKNMGSPSVDPQLYRSLVGSLIYLTNTRSDICYAVSCVSRYMDQPEEIHLAAAKRILRYLSGTSNYGLFLLADSNNTLATFADADWGRDIDTRRSTSGILHKLGDSSIYWVSKMQPTVSLSTTEAEYRVLSDASKDIIYFRRLLAEIGIENTDPTTIMSDNQSCIRLVENPVLHSRTKHIGLQYHFIREASKSGEVHVDYVPTNYQQADFLTKPLSNRLFLANRQNAGIIQNPHLENLTSLQETYP